MKKKITVAALAICLMSILVGTSLAYFMDTDEATNTFTVGSVEIEQYEQQRGDGGNLENFENDKQLLPIVKINDVKSDANFQDKIVTVKNTGKNAAYVQTFVAVPKELDDKDVLQMHWPDTNDAWEEPVVVDTIEEKMIVEGSDSTLKYNIYKIVYKANDGKLEPGRTTDASLEGVYIDQRAEMDVERNAEDVVTGAYFKMGEEILKEYNAISKLNIYVASQAVQADGFTSANEALQAAFPNHPWVTN